MRYSLFLFFRGITLFACFLISFQSLAQGPLNVNFSASDSIFCSSTCVSYHDLTTGHPIAWYWQFEGGTPDTSTVQNPPYVCYSKAGHYHVILTVGTADSGKSLDKYFPVVIGDIPGTITATKDTICSGTPANLFLIGHSGNIIQWQSTPNYTDFSNIPVTDSFYTGTPTQSTWYRAIVGSGSCIDTSLWFEIIVPPPIFANFTYSVIDTQVTFNSFLENIISAHWDFGDSSTADNIDNPVHNYLSKDTFNVCLTIVDGSGCSSMHCEKVDLRSSGVNNISSNSLFNVYPSPFSNKLFIDFSNNTSPIKTIQLFDVLGRKLTEVNLTNDRSNIYQMDIPTITSGVYYLRVKTAGANYVVKVVRE